MSATFLVESSRGPIGDEHRAVLSGIARTKPLVSSFDPAPYGRETLSRLRQLWHNARDWWYHVGHRWLPCRMTWLALRKVLGAR